MLLLFLTQGIDWIMSSFGLGSGMEITRGMRWALRFGMHWKGCIWKEWVKMELWARMELGLRVRGGWSIKRNYYETPIFFFFIEYYETPISINKLRQSIWLKKQNIYVPIDTSMLFWNYRYFNIYIYIYIYCTLYNINLLTYMVI